MSAPRQTIAMLGTGRMGAPIARNLLAADFPLSVWNRTLARATPLADDGARVAASPAEAAERSEVVLTMLTNGDAIEATMDGPDGALTAMRPGSIWIQMASVGVEWTQRLAKLAAEHDVEFVDAPVSGSDGPARDRQLVVLASGPQELRAILEPIFDAIGRKTLWLGPAGQGTRLKVVLNNWLATQVEAVAETMALAEELGVHEHVFTDTIADSPLGSAYAVAKGQAMLAEEFAPGFALGLAFKDVGLALDAARDVGLELPLTSALGPRWQEAIAEGHGDEDVAVVISAARPETAETAKSAETAESPPPRG